MSSEPDGLSTPEAMLELCKTFLAELVSLLERVNLAKARRQVWSDQIKELEEYRLPNAYIGVCGSTGAGKSTLLNSLLGGHYLPTSGDAACTAVVTEVSFHEKEKPEAEVTFISKEEWAREVQLLFDEYVNKEDGSREAQKPRGSAKSNATIAWSKITAVYPNHSYQHISTMTAEQVLAIDKDILERLGTTETLQCATRKEFSDKLTEFVAPPRRPLRDKSSLKPPKLWPLIQQVKIFCNAPVLSSGGILVDLPGVADSNAARANVAGEYIKKCDFLWIAAPIERIVDDKAAKELLGRSFKTQLMLDGNYADSKITFIATKSDNLEVDEAIRSYDLSDEESFIKLDSDWQAVVDQLQVLKRELKLAEGPPRKRLRLQSQDEDDNMNSQGSSNSDDTTGSTSEPDRLNGLRNSVLRLEKERSHKGLLRKAFCARRRVEFVVEELKHQFREGIEEFDEMQNQAKRRDYNEVDVAVFGTSARDYSALQGLERSASEADPLAFDHIADTGVPALHEHCRQLATLLRRRSLSVFLQQLTSLTDSVKLFLDQVEQVSTEDTSILRRKWAAQEDGDSEDLKKSISPIITRLSKEFLALVELTAGGLERLYGEQLEAQSDHAATEAAKHGRAVYEEFIYKMRWNTHLATMRREGEFHRSLNEELSRPFTEHLIKSWSAAFSPDGLEFLSPRAQQIVKSLIDEIVESAPPGLKDRVEVHGGQCLDVVDKDATALIDLTQSELARHRKNLWRFFSPETRKQLAPAYKAAVDVPKGTGSYNRQKEAFCAFLEKDEAKSEIFKQVADLFKQELATSALTIRVMLFSNLEKIATRIQINLSALWDGEDNDHQQKTARERVKTHLTSMSALITRYLN